MAKTYFRPLGLCYGSDAEQLIASHRAGRLGGRATIGFTLVERITRDGKSINREIIPYTDALQAIEAPRSEFAYLLAKALLKGKPLETCRPRLRELWKADAVGTEGLFKKLIQVI